jgi:hypothetical protein
MAWAPHTNIPTRCIKALAEISIVRLIDVIDLLEAWETTMADIGNRLKIKYGLGRDPSPERSQEWARLTQQYINQGMSRQTAGEAAAKYLFRDYNTHVYASEADTIEMLLQQVADKK